MRKKPFMLISLLLLVIWNCSGTKREDDGTRIDPNQDRLIEVLTLFVESVQGDRFEKALTYLTPSERSKMTEGSGETTPRIKRQLKSLRLSTLAQKSGVRLEKDKLTGIFEWLPSVDTAAPTPPQDLDAPLIQ